MTTAKCCSRIHWPLLRFSAGSREVILVNREQRSTGKGALHLCSRPEDMVECIKMVGDIGGVQCEQPILFCAGFVQASCDFGRVPSVTLTPYLGAQSHVAPVAIRCDGRNRGRPG